MAKMTPEEKANDPLAGVRCQGHSKHSGERCKRRPIPGGFVCVIHGGGVPTVRAKALQRLESMLPLALKTMKRNAKQRRDLGVSQRAAEAITKMNNLEPAAQVDATVTYRWSTPTEEPKPPGVG